MRAPWIGDSALNVIGVEKATWESLFNINIDFIERFTMISAHLRTTSVEVLPRFLPTQRRLCIVDAGSIFFDFSSGQQG
jgi:hypothetical protein